MHEEQWVLIFVRCNWSLLGSGIRLFKYLLRPDRIRDVNSDGRPRVDISNIKIG